MAFRSHGIGDILFLVIMVAIAAMILDPRRRTAELIRQLGASFANLLSNTVSGYRPTRSRSSTSRPRRGGRASGRAGRK
jgi:hypothetical protein